MGLPSRLRNSTASIGLVTVTSPRISSVDVLQHIKEDLIQGMVKGVPGKDAKGRNFTFLLNLVGLLCDFHESAYGLDTMTHGANAHCGLCSFRERGSQGGTQAKNSYSTWYNASNSAVQRTTHYGNQVAEDVEMVEKVGNGVSDAEALQGGEGAPESGKGHQFVEDEVLEEGSGDQESDEEDREAMEPAHKKQRVHGEGGGASGSDTGQAQVATPLKRVGRHLQVIGELPENNPYRRAMEELGVRTLCGKGNIAEGVLRFAEDLTSFLASKIIDGLIWVRKRARRTH